MVPYAGEVNTLDRVGCLGTVLKFIPGDTEVTVAVTRDRDPRANDTGGATRPAADATKDRD